jgi:hypothetical protein
MPGSHWRSKEQNLKYAGFTLAPNLHWRRKNQKPITTISLWLKDHVVNKVIQNLLIVRTSQTKTQKRRE